MSGIESLWLALTSTYNYLVPEKIKRPKAIAVLEQQTATLKENIELAQLFEVSKSIRNSQQQLQDSQGLSGIPTYSILGYYFDNQHLSTSRKRGPITSLNNQQIVENQNVTSHSALVPSSPDTDEISNVSTDEEESAYLTCTSGAPTEQLELEEPPLTSPSRQLIVKRPSYHKIVLFALLLVLVLIFALEISMLEKSSYFKTASNIPNAVGSPSQIPTVSDKTIEIQTIESYQGYVSFTQTANVNKYVSLRIYNLDYWPKGFSNLDHSKIHEIHVECYISYNDLYFLLQRSINLRMLHMNNTGNNICANSKSSEENAILPKSAIRTSIQTVILTNFGTVCMHVTSMVATQMIMYNLEKVRFHNCQVNSQNLNHIQGVLKDARKTLREVEFVGTTFTRSLFTQTEPGSLQNVDTVVFEILQNQLNFVLGSSFHFTFPNLQNVAMQKYPVSINQISEIFKCANLKSLKLEVEIPTDTSNFSVMFLKENFTALESAQIKLHYNTCPKEEHQIRQTEFSNNVLGIKSLPITLAKQLKLSSNCKLFIGL